MKFDSFLFGHPSGRYFQSQLSFLPHFLSLVKNELDKCQCKPCGKMKMSEGTAVQGKAGQRTRRVVQPSEYYHASYVRSFIDTY